MLSTTALVEATTACELALVAIVALICGHIIKSVIYNLYWSPLSRFPGPKLAAASLIYEFYYDVVKGTFPWEIQRMHNIYGPIVRINPYEIHINDPEYYDEIYAGGGRTRDKYDWFTRQGGSPTSTFATGPHQLHRQRRKILGPLFSTPSVEALEPMINSKVELLCNGLRRCMHQGKIVELGALYMALALDTITHYSFGESQCWNCLHHEEFAAELRTAIVDSFGLSNLARYCPWILNILLPVPRSIVGIVNQSMKLWLQTMDVIRKHTHHYFNKSNDEGPKEDLTRTVFYHLRNSDAPIEERSFGRLADEGNILVAAGGEVVSQYLAVVSFHLLQNPDCIQRLRKELSNVMPNPDSAYTGLLNVCESAVVTEGFRITALVVTRLPRIPTSEDLVYKEWCIPRGTPVSSTSHFIHLDPTIWKDPLVFDPERWLQDEDKTRLLHRYLVPFSRGSRQCLGIHFANAQLYLALATVFRRFDLELFDPKIPKTQTPK
ncbi:hypothetical protein V500_00083 [Pseudogymnoascus sp. VKM F-4518 (FW-2643)]|nr:hypothetical protein V500_00083 [Pseudogymnoascus sp. VKM F-4518 (FW-2643)]